MSRVTEMDWHAWHDDYDEPGTPPARRLAAVQGRAPGAHRFTANPVPLERGARMFRFTRRPDITFHPERAGRVPRRTTRARLGRPPGRVPGPGPPPTRRSGCAS